MNRPDKQPSRVLGRGLSSLIGTATAAPAEAAGTTMGTAPALKSRIVDVALDAIVPGKLQTRKEFVDGTLNELAQSIRAVGVVQPVVVRPIADGKYELISGERRWRASRLAERATIPALIREDHDEQVLQISLVENIQREDLNAVDRARGYKLFCDTFDLSVEEVARRTGENRATVSNYIRLLELPQLVLQCLRDGRITMGHARAMLALPIPAAQCEAFLNRVIANDYSVRQLEKEIAEFKRGGFEPRGDPAPGSANAFRRSPQIRHLETRIQERIGMKCRLSVGRDKGKGSLYIKFSDLDQFDRLMKLLDIETE